jgi:hypothetical protein
MCDVICSNPSLIRVSYPRSYVFQFLRFCIMFPFSMKTKKCLSSCFLVSNTYLVHLFLFFTFFFFFSCSFTFLRLSCCLILLYYCFSLTFVGVSFFCFLSPGLNFINILRPAFTYVSFTSSFFVLTFYVCTLLAQDCWRKSCT